MSRSFRQRVRLALLGNLFPAGAGYLALGRGTADRRDEEAP